jgi:hypothetical protein
MRTTDDLLLCLLDKIAAFGALPEHVLDRRYDTYVQGMIVAGVPYEPAVWLGSPLDGSQRMGLTRLVRRAELAGLLIRVCERDRDRVRNLVPTLAGLQRALDLAGANVDRELVLVGLQRTHWGLLLAHELDSTPATTPTLQPVPGIALPDDVAHEPPSVV